MVYGQGGRLDRAKGDARRPVPEHDVQANGSIYTITHQKADFRAGIKLVGEVSPEQTQHAFAQEVQSEQRQRGQAEIRQPACQGVGIEQTPQQKVQQDNQHIDEKLNANVTDNRADIDFKPILGMNRDNQTERTAQNGGLYIFDIKPENEQRQIYPHDQHQEPGPVSNAL